MIFCRDCLHYRRYDENWPTLDACVHPSLPEKRDRVRGEPMEHYCSDVRGFSGPCGENGKLFQAKPDMAESEKFLYADEPEPDRYPDDRYLDAPEHGQADELNKQR